MLVVVLLLLFLNTEFHSLVHDRNCTWIVNYHVRILLRIHCRDGYSVLYNKKSYKSRKFQFILQKEKQININVCKIHPIFGIH